MATTTPTQSKPRTKGCKQNSRYKHTKGDLWSCQECGKKACSRCVKYFWKRSSRTGDVVLDGGKISFVGERVAICRSCLK